MSERINDQQEAALLARRGWAAFPVKPRRKAPPMKGWRKSATTDLDQIARWWSTGALANIGIDCGSSGLVAIDLDVRNGVDGPAAWEKLCGELGIPPWNTAMVSTPSGGRHLYYRAPNGSNLGNSAGRLGPGIDVRADGGYVLAPPSVTDEGTYTWLNGQSLVPLPAEILGKLHTQASPPVSSRRGDTAHATSAYVRTAVEAEVRRSPLQRREDATMP